MPDVVREVRRRLAEAADADRAPAMQAYMKSAMPFRGVPAPTVRRICREVFAAGPLPDRPSWEAAVRALWDDAGYREERYAALALTTHRLYRSHQDPSTLPLYRHLVITGAWWDYVDSIAAHNLGGLLRTHPADLAPVMRAWARDEDLWLRRSAILCQLRSRADTDTTLLADVLTENLARSPHGSEFFIRKAVGWALREHAKTDATWVREYLDKHATDMSGLSRREALKYV